MAPPSAAAAVAKSAEARPPGFAKHSATTESALSVSPGEAGSSSSSTSGTTSTTEMAADAKSVVEARPFGIANSAKTDSALEMLPSEAGSCGSRAGGTTRVVGVPKISCQGKVEVAEIVHQERNSEWRGKQSRVMGVRKISCQKNVEVFAERIMNSFDARSVLVARWPSLK